VRTSRHEPRVLSGDWSALIASGRGGTPRLEEGPDGFSGDTSGTADRLAVTERPGAHRPARGQRRARRVRDPAPDHGPRTDRRPDSLRRYQGRARPHRRRDLRLLPRPDDQPPQARNARRCGARRLGPVRRVGKLRRAVAYGGVSLHRAEGAQRGAHGGGALRALPPAAIATQCPLDRHEQFVCDFDCRAAEGFRNQVLIGMMVEAHISKSKYRHVIASIKLVTAAAPLGFASAAALGIAT
jgi:hypothetical protein